MCGSIITVYSTRNDILGPWRSQWSGSPWLLYCQWFFHGFRSCQRAGLTFQKRVQTLVAGLETKAESDRRHRWASFWGYIRVKRRRMGGIFGSLKASPEEVKMALPKAQELVSNNPVVVFRWRWTSSRMMIFYVSVCFGSIFMLVFSFHFVGVVCFRVFDWFVDEFGFWGLSKWECLLDGGFYLAPSGLEIELEGEFFSFSFGSALVYGLWFWKSRFFRSLLLSWWRGWLSTVLLIFYFICFFWPINLEIFLHKFCSF